MAMPAIGALGLQGLKKIGSTVGDAVQGSGGEVGGTETTTTPTAPLETGSTAVQSALNIPVSEQAAGIGLEQAAKIKGELGAPAGAAEATSGSGLRSTGAGFLQASQQEFQAASQQAHSAVLAAESALNTAASNATIDPEAYLHSMGTGQKVLTSIGMVLSGIGSGLTGQPNMAVDMYNKNTQRAIEAQQANFQNLATTAAANAGLLKTAQDRMIIAKDTANMATMAVLTGNNVAIDGVTNQINSATALPFAAQLKFQNNQQSTQALGNYNRDYISAHQAQDTHQLHLKTAIGAAVAGYIGSQNKKGAIQNQQGGSPQDVGTSSAIQKARDQLGGAPLGFEAPQSLYDPNKPASYDNRPPNSKWTNKIPLKGFPIEDMGNAPSGSVPGASVEIPGDAKSAMSQDDFAKAFLKKYGESP